MTPEQFSAFMKRFFPSFLLGFFSALFGISITVMLWALVYWSIPVDIGRNCMALGGSMVLMLCLGSFVMIRGYRWGLWVNWAVLGTGLLIGLSLLGSSASQVALGVGFMLQLVSLLAFNSQRHRKMRAGLIELRIERSRT